MLGLRVYMYDEVVPTETHEDIQELVKFLSDFLRLRGKYSSRLQKHWQEELPFDIVPSLSIRKMAEWLEMAWRELGEPEFGATSDEIYNALDKLGFQSTAGNPKAAVKASIRLGGQFQKIGVGRNKEAIWDFRQAPVLPIVKPPRFSLDDPRGRATKQKVVDYAIRALIEMKGKANKEDLARLMTEYGWKTKSVDRPGLVAATLRKYQEFEKQGELWVFSQSYKDQSKSD